MGGRKQTRIAGVLLGLLAIGCVAWLASPFDAPRSRYEDSTAPAPAQSAVAPGLRSSSHLQPNVVADAHSEGAAALIALYDNLSPSSLPDDLWRIRFRVSGPSHWARAVFVPEEDKNNAKNVLNSFMGPRHGSIVVKGTGYLVVRANGYAAWSSDLLLPPASRVMSLQIPMEAGLSVRGHVVQADGVTPAPNTAVSIEPVSEDDTESALTKALLPTTTFTIADKNGRFEFQGLREGQVRLSLGSRHEEVAVVDKPVFAGDHDVTIRCTRLISVLVRVHLRGSVSNTMDLRARIEYTDAAGVQRRTHATNLNAILKSTEPDRTRMIPTAEINLPAGTDMPIRVIAPGYERMDHTIVTPADGRHEVNVTLEPLKERRDTLELAFEANAGLPRGVNVLFVREDYADARLPRNWHGYRTEFEHTLEIRDGRVMVPIISGCNHLILIYDKGRSGWADTFLSLTYDDDKQLIEPKRTVKLARTGQVRFDIGGGDGDLLRLEGAHVHLHERYGHARILWRNVSLTRMGTPSRSGATSKIRSFEKSAYIEKEGDLPTIKRIRPGTYDYEVTYHGLRHRGRFTIRAGQTVTTKPKRATSSDDD